MPLTTPSASTYTILLKHSRTTILLHADPLTTLSALRTELLHALHDTQRDGTLSGQPLPTTPSDIALARPADATDLSKGWIRLTGVAGKKDGGAEESVKSAEVRDGGVVAFRWGEGEGAGAGKGTGAGESYDVDEEGNVVEMGWDVVVPRYEDGEGEDEGVEA